MESTSTGAPFEDMVAVKVLKYVTRFGYCDGSTEPLFTRLLLSFMDAGGVHGVARIFAPCCFAFCPSRIASVQLPSGAMRRRMSVRPIWLGPLPYKASTL